MNHTPTDAPRKRDVLSKRGRLAIFTRHYGADSKPAQQAAAELRAAMLEEHIRRVVDDAAPPLADGERARLASILRGSP